MLSDVHCRTKEEQFPVRFRANLDHYDQFRVSHRTKGSFQQVHVQRKARWRRVWGQSLVRTKRGPEVLSLNTDAPVFKYLKVGLWKRK